MWGPDYIYFDLPRVKLNPKWFNRWTVMVATVFLVILGASTVMYVTGPGPTSDRIAWGKTVDPTLWEMGDQSPGLVTTALLEYRPDPDTRARGGSSRLLTVAKVPVGQTVVIVARYKSGGGYEMADNNGVFNDQCSVVPGGTVRVIGQHHAQVLVDYDPPLRAPKSASMCTSKEMFYLEVTAA